MGYYVMPDRLVGRADLRMDRAARPLIAPHPWLERSASAREVELVKFARTQSECFETRGRS